MYRRLPAMRTENLGGHALCGARAAKDSFFA
jgi:hypothetical protein